MYVKARPLKQTATTLSENRCNKIQKGEKGISSMTSDRTRDGADAEKESHYM